MLVFLIVVFLILLVYNRFFLAPYPEIVDVSIKDNIVTVKYKTNDYNLNNKMYCMISKDYSTPSKDSDKVFAKNNACTFEIDDNIYSMYLMNMDGYLFYVEGSSEVGSVLSFEVNKEKVYLAVSGSEKLTYRVSSVGNVDKSVSWSSEDESIATVVDGVIHGESKGSTNIKGCVKDICVNIETIVSDLIIVRPDSFNNSKPYLSCGLYSKEDNDLLDEILKDRINSVGYKTRAGVVEAARFLALEFPYKIRYFSENGRLATNGVDGEGRYYHVGLYLHESRYENITKSMNGPKTWGCQMYSRPSKGKRANGFDCSGFVSWVLLNGGFDVGDIGAGLASHLDLTDYGERIKFNASVVSSGKVKVGDLLSSGGVEGGHIALIVGEDEENYYVAESLWTPPNTSVVIMTYSKKTIFNRYYYVMLMDSYYESDGNLTSLWY